MKAALIGKVVALILAKIVEPATLRKFGGTLLKFIEDFVLGTKSKVDDAIVLPLCDMIRDTYDMNEYGDVKELLAAVTQAMVDILSGERLKEFCDMILDFAENYVMGTGSTIDDALVLPLCNMIRTTFNIPDNDDPVGDGPIEPPHDLPPQEDVPFEPPDVPPIPGPGTTTEDMEEALLKIEEEGGEG